MAYGFVAAFNSEIKLHIYEANLGYPSICISGTIPHIFVTKNSAKSGMAILHITNDL
jgi:hypothetical protein